MGTGLVVGLGARRGVAARAVRELLDRVAAEHGLDLDGAGYATVEARTGEPGLVAALGGVPNGCPAAELALVDVPNPSARVAAATGTPSVAEAAALLVATRRGGPGAAVTLVVPKTTGDGVTAAVARHGPGLTCADPPGVGPASDVAHDSDALRAQASVAMLVSPPTGGNPVRVRDGPATVTGHAREPDLTRGVRTTAGRGHPGKERAT